ncbi:MAG: CDP-glucose 4,6-dehydratase [Trueperaceae bacterium]|nr:CDP-glucose 4,6-dehydratase [Trueperaceae bacterium]
MTPGFWRGKRVLLTGHTGFKGSWASLWLHALGADVVGYALPPEAGPNLFELAGVADVLTSVTGDVRDGDHLQRVFEEHEPEIVIHMAAQALVRHSFEHPVETYDTNMMGTVHVLEAARRTGSVRVVVCVTSDKCYANRETERPYVEDDPMGGSDPYSSSKGCAELVVSAYRRTYFPVGAGAAHGTAVASVRAGNVIGGGDWARDRLVVDVASAYARGEAPVIRNPDAVRPWQFVLEPLAGYLLVAERAWTEPATYATGWNFGPERLDCQPVGWVVDRIAQAWGATTSWIHDERPNRPEAQLLLLDVTKARTELGWRPRLDLANAIDWTVEWYRAHGRGDDVRALTLEQIARYERMATA